MWQNYVWFSVKLQNFFLKEILIDFIFHGGEEATLLLPDPAASYALDLTPLLY